MYLGIEFGSTRIKATAIDRGFLPQYNGDYTWQSTYENGIWTYDLQQALQGLRAALSGLQNPEEIQAVGISGMMHGYLAFDRDWNLLVPFRTWQNTVTAQAAEELTALFGFNIPQRWSVAHLYQAMLNGEEHVSRIAHVTTLAGYIHYLLTGVHAVGIGEASGIFPIDSQTLSYNRTMLEQCNKLFQEFGWNRPVEEVFPTVLRAGTPAGFLTAKGAALTGNVLKEGTPFAPPEGDAGTGMVATNAVAARTGNISAGTSVFSMLVLEKPLRRVYSEIDMVTTPAGKAVAMVHCNNCTADSNAWASLLLEAAKLFGANPSGGALFEALYRTSLEGEADCGGVLACNYLAGEGITHLDAGVPMVLRRAESRFTLANFLRATLYSSIATLRLGMEILEEEGVKTDSLVGHGGFFKTPEVGQRYMAAACNAPITCMKTAGEGGPYGMALLAAFLFAEEESLELFLSERVFKTAEKTTVFPDQATVEGFQRYMKDYKKLLELERKAVEMSKKDE